MRTKIVIALILLVLAAAAYNIIRITSIKNYMIENLDSAIKYANSGDFENAKKISDKLFEKWKEEEKKLKLYYRRNYVDEAADVLSELSPYAVESTKEIFTANAQKAKNIIEHIWESEMPTLDSILKVNAPAK